MGRLVGYKYQEPRGMNNTIKQPSERMGRLPASHSASEESIELRSRVEPEHQRHDEISAFQCVSPEMK